MNYPSPLTDEEIRRRRPHGILEDGERAHFDIALIRDSAPGRVFMTDQQQRDGVAQARRQWLADRETAYRNERPAAEAQQREPVAVRAAGSASIADARNARLHRLANAYRG